MYIQRYDCVYLCFVSLYLVCCLFILKNFIFLSRIKSSLFVAVISISITMKLKCKKENKNCKRISTPSSLLSPVIRKHLALHTLAMTLEVLQLFSFAAEWLYEYTHIHRYVFLNNCSCVLIYLYDVSITCHRVNIIVCQTFSFIFSLKQTVWFGCAKHKSLFIFQFHLTFTFM